ncbi:hypothetical protein ATO7_10272 [Oceanococcus atlanticus]|uniref:Uncharacterized protein n=1 Tax=Oceanococcus atlanticus TaxID=1317117 RepID=A0A1Y1SEK4_9GAMM|nr:hypothetical protein ATO7_10272 [Oceanococcus atlanticus]
MSTPRAVRQTGQPFRSAQKNQAHGQKAGLYAALPLATGKKKEQKTQPTQHAQMWRQCGTVVH